MKLVLGTDMLNKIFGIAISALLAAAGAAHADGVFDCTRYSLGGEMSLLNRTTYSSANTPDLNNFRASDSDSELVIRRNRPGFTLYAQARFNPYFAIEAGYSWILKVSGTAQGGNQATNKISTPFLDFLGFMPIAERVDLIGEVGIGFIKSKANVSNVTFSDLESFNTPRVGYRLGVGALFYLTNNWGTRIMLRYQDGGSAFLTGNTSLAIGLQYTF